MLTPLLFRDEYIGILAVETLGRLPVEYTVGLKALCAEVALALQSTALLRGIVAFAKNVGMSVTGEGVETSEHSACLRALGCDHAQGFLFARPSPPEAITALLDEQQSDPQRLAA